MGLPKNNSKKKSLSTGRPPLAKKSAATFSSKATRTIIRKHHTLLKEQEKAIKSGDASTASAIAEQISQDGGIEKYQHASQIGQLTSRGGDTSKVLVAWLEESDSFKSRPFRVLEVGCLSPENAISKCSNARLVRIDLHSTHPSIEEQDFLARPLPRSEEEKFDLISLSLVVNFVPDAASRGEMLRRTTDFLRTAYETEDGFARLFLTLPLPCINNSRYMTEGHLMTIMISLGYVLIHAKSTMKIYYSLWRFDRHGKRRESFRKSEIVPGRTRNNFSIILG